MTTATATATSTATSTTQHGQRRTARPEPRGKLEFLQYGITAPGWDRTEPAPFSSAVLLAEAAPGVQVMQRSGRYGGRHGWGCRFEDWIPYIPTPVTSASTLPWWR